MNRLVNGGAAVDRTASPCSASPRARRAAVAVIGAATALNLWAMRHLLRMATWPNDLSFHLSMVSWATDRFRQGHVPTDGWFPRLSGGLPQFHHYQSLPHLLAGLVGVPLGAEQSTHLLLWVLVGTWPIAVYLGARAFGLTVRAAVLAALVAPLVRSPTGYGFEPFSYLWIGNGLWSQAWGMWMAPLALGWSARAVRTGAGYGRAVAAVALTVAFHLPTAWFVLVAIGLWALVRPGAWRERVPRVVGLSVLATVASAWVLVPFLVDRWAVNDSSFNGQGVFGASFGWRRVLGWALAGDLIDARRLPLLSIVAAAGLLIALRRWRTPRDGDREVVLVTAASLVLFVGEDPFGAVIGLVPGASEVFLHRYVATLQLGLVLLVGIGGDAVADALARWSSRVGVGRMPRLAEVGAVLGLIAAALVVAPAVVSTRTLVEEDRSWVAQQAIADGATGDDAAELVAIAHERGGGRIYAGKLNGWGGQFRIGSASAPIWLAHLPVDAMGFNLRVSALAADLETYLDESTAADLDAFGIRYVLVPRGQRPPTGAWFLAARGDVQLWELPGEGMVSAVSVVGPALPVATDRLAAELLPVMRAQGGSPTSVRLLELAGRSPSITAQRAATDRPGRLRRTRLALDEGKMSTTAVFDAPGAVLVKANWHPRWTATVDGEEVPVAAVAPTWLAIPVGPGTHEVELRYRPWSATWWLGLLAILAVTIGWAWSGGPRSRGLRRSTRSRGPKGPRGPTRRRIGAAASTACLVLLVGCGAPHGLAPVDVPAIDGRSPVAGVELRREDSYATLDRVIAPEGRTVVVVGGPECDACAGRLSDLMADAFGRTPYSVLAIGLPTLPAALEVESVATGVSAWSSASSPARVRKLLRVGPDGGVAVLDPDGTVVKSWTSVPASVAAVVDLAQAEPGR